MGEKRSIGALGAIGIGIGAIVGGGFFATFGLTIAGAEGGTPIAFLLGGLIALLTAYSYVRLTLRYPDLAEPCRSSDSPLGGGYWLQL